MADHNRRSISPLSRRSLERQQSIRSLRSIESNTTDVFSDEFSYEPLTVADGSRSGSPDRNATERSPSPPQSIRSTRSTRSTVRRSAVLPPQESYPSDLPKKRIPSQVGASASAVRNPFSLRNDVEALRRQSSMSTTSDRIYRPLSTISTASIVRTDSPFTGPSGPSHPYGMYPQGTALNRAPSLLATHSTDRNLGVPNRPGHPYGMYSQTMLDSTGADTLLAGSTDIASVGFPGLGQQYIRQQGPEGEGADDIIGPDGHTEQLPPYSRYPDAPPPKLRSVPGGEATPLMADGPQVDSNLANARRPRAPTSPQADSNLLDVSTQPQRINSHMGFSPTDSLLSDSDDTMVNVAAASSAGISDESVAINEKYTTRRRDHKFFGWLPCWAVCVGVGILVVLAAVLGGAIGRFMHHPMPPPPTASATAAAIVNANDTVYQTLTTTLIDAAFPTSTPSNLPPLPVGSFGVPMSMPAVSSNACLSSGSASEMAAWQCLALGYMGLNISQLTYSGATGYDALFYPLWFYQNGGLRYGPQPPNMRGPASVQLMTDIDDPGLGPAYFFQQLHDKIVIVPPDQLVPQNSKRSAAKRSSLEERKLEGRDQFRYVQASDQPWFCYWNSTILEGFIYVTQDISPPASNVTNMVNSLADGEQPTAVPTATTSATASGAWPTNVPSIYPKVVKIEERRNTNMPQPYCQKMQLSNGGGIVPVLDGHGNIITISLNETEPTVQDKMILLKAGLKPITGRDLEYRVPLVQRDDQSCDCQWISS